MKTTKKSKNRAIAVTAALSALTVLLAVTHLGLIPMLNISITILHIPVILAAVLVGFSSSTATGFVFGMTSLIMAAAMPSSPMDPFFMNPLISVLPRIIFAIATWSIFKALTSIRNFPSIVAVGITAFLGTLIHAFLVLGVLVIAKAITAEIAFAVFASNSILEAIAATIITVAVFSIKMATVSSSKKSHLSQENEE